MRVNSVFGRIFSLITYIVVICAVALGILWVIPSNDVILMPGSAQQTCTFVHVQGGKCVDPNSGVFDTYVNEVNAQHLLYVVLALVHSDDTVSPATDFTGNCPTYENELVQMMAQSKIEAEASALHAAKVKLRYENWGPEVIEVTCGVPASTKLNPGDRILAVDGHPIAGKCPSRRVSTSAEPGSPCRNLKLKALWPCLKAFEGEPGCRLYSQVHYYVDLHRPGTSVSLTILRNGRRIQLHIRTVRATPNDGAPKGTRTLIGIQMALPFQSPVKINIDTGDVSGPSAGLAFALSIYEQLTHTNLTKGNKVAVTGQIAFRAPNPLTGKVEYGQVVEIGGARQKAIAAQAAGAKYFLVPPGNYAEAKSAGTNLIIKPVETLQQAIDILKSLPAPSIHS